MLPGIRKERLDRTKRPCEQNLCEEKESHRENPCGRENAHGKRLFRKAETIQRKKQNAEALRKWSVTLFCVLACSLVLNIGVSAAHRAILQRGIAEEVLRFHVLANSDSEEDQKVKYLVRDAVLEKIRGNTESSGNGSREMLNGKDAELRFLQTHLPEIEEAANRVLEEQKMPYRAQASIENCYFPERSYGNCTFPAGWYDALRVRLGEARGHNWWCVLYPALCFSDCLHAVVDEGELAELKTVLTVEEYESLLRKPKKWKIAFRWF